MNQAEEHYVIFYSPFPGTSFSEVTTEPIPSWDARLAVDMARQIAERHGANPFGFRFKTYLVREPIRADGVEFRATPELVRRSGMYFITGKIRHRASILQGTDPEESTLRSKVLCHGYKVIIENRNSYVVTASLEEEDVVVGRDGHVITTGEIEHERSDRLDALLADLTPDPGAAP